MRRIVTTLALCSLSLLVAACGAEPTNTVAVNVSANRAAVTPTATPAAANSDAHAEIPEFPWPPPKASVRTTLPREFFVGPQGPTLLADVSNKLRNAFSNCGYGEISWYSAPNGFVLVSQLEQFKPDGTPLDGEGRWAVSVLPQQIFSVSDYLRALFTAPRGRFRVIAFVVTDQPFTQREKELSAEEAADLLRGGASGLPPSIGQREFTNAHECHALVYEYERQSNRKPAIFLRPGRLAARTHLTGARLLNQLEGQP